MALQKIFEQIAPASLIRYSQVLQLERQILTLGANNGAIAAKLRQLAPELAKAFQDRGCEITGIQVRVQVIQTVAQSVAKRTELSIAGQQRLIELAMELPDSPLKNALKRLAEKHKEKQ
jgi:hypothetical protein